MPAVSQNDTRQPTDKIKMKTSKTKNIQKGLAYKLAHEQINAAINSRPPFPIEAIAIEESILSDRLYSALVARRPIRAEKIQSNNRKPAEFGTILGEIVEIPSFNASSRIFTTRPEFDDLNAALSEKGGVKSLFDWKEARNKFVHGLARSLHPKETTQIGSDVYYEKGLAVAREGLELVRIVETWSQKCVRAAMRATKKKS